MKILNIKKLLLVLLCFPMIGFGQSKSILISENTFGGELDCKNEMKVNLSTNDTSYFIFCSYQNREYKSIIDLGSIYISNKEKLNSIISQLKKCISYMDDETISYSVGQFKIYDFSKNLYIIDNSDYREKYTHINKKAAVNWLKWLENCKVY